MKKKKLAAAACFISCSVITMHMLNKLLFYLSSKNEKLFNENNFYYKWTYGRIYYTKKGSGSPLLLIHDLSCTSSGYEWTEIIRDLAKTHTVYTVDLPGCGRSDKPEILYTPYFYVSFIRDFCKDIIKEKTAVAATGKAAPLALMTASNNPELVSRIILVNPESPEQKGLLKKPCLTLLKTVYTLPILGTFLYHCTYCYCGVKRAFRKSCFADRKRIKGRTILAYREAAHLHGASSRFLHLSIRCGYTNTFLVHALPKIRQRVTVLSGRDCPNAKEIFNEYKYYMPNIRQRYIDHSSGLPQMERPKEFVKELDETLQEPLSAAPSA